MNSTSPNLAELPTLLRGETESASAWVAQPDARRLACWLAIIVVGSALYGAAMGWWRAPLQAAYTAAKFPLVIVLTTLGNALLNGMLAPLLGVNLGFRQSLLAVWMSFVIAASILGALAPVLLFVVWNTPPFDAGPDSSVPAYRFMQLAVVAGIAGAGVVANVRLLPLLRRHASGERAARRVLFAWLAGNLFLGSQICWMLRPFIGRPMDAVTFLGPDPFEGNFFETVFEAVRVLVLQ